MAGTLTISTLSDGTNSTSSTNPILGSSRAWVQFNGTNGAIRASYNVSSVTRTAVGRYTTNFTNAFPNANYTWALGAFNGDTSSVYAHMAYVQAPTTTQFLSYVYNYAGSPSDVLYVSAIFI